MTTPKAVIRRYTDAGYNENNPAVIEETVDHYRENRRIYKTAGGLEQ